MDQTVAIAQRTEKEEALSFLWYVEDHSKTERALFSGAHINKLLKMAGPMKGMVESVPADNKEFYALHFEDAEPLILKARERLERPQLRLIIGGKH